MSGARSLTRAEEHTRRGRRRAGVVVIVGLTLVGVSGCGGDSSGISGDIAVEWTFTPSTTTAATSDREEFEWMAPYRVTLRETSGNQGGTVTNVNVSIYERVGEEVGAQTDQADTVLTFETARLEPRGTLNLDFNSYYTLANEGRTAAIDVFVFIRDDEGFDLQVGRRLAVE